MAERSSSQKNRQQKKVLRRFALLFAFAVLCAVLFTPGYGFFSYRSTVKQKERIAQENERLRQENSELSEEINRLKNDEKYLEDFARREHGMLKKNEEVYDFSR